MNYKKVVDCWTFGCLLYEMITGKSPFRSNEINRLLSKIIIGKFKIPAYVPEDAKDLI